MPSDWGLQAAIKKTIDTHKIQTFASKAAVRLLVGFPNGRQHVTQQHRDDEGNIKNYDGSTGAPEVMETAVLAAMLHDGTSDIPARPFLEDGLESKKTQLSAAIKQQEQKVQAGEPANWDKVGTMAVGAIQELVRSDYYKSSVPNSEKTQKYKGSDTPLIDTGDLLNSLAYVKEDGSIGTKDGLQTLEEYVNK